MALTLNFNTTATTDSGTSLTSAYARLETITNSDEATITIKILFYESEQAYSDNRLPILLDEIPKGLGILVVDITPAQYVSVDMSNVHTYFRNVLLNGNNLGSYPDHADQSWMGLLGIDPLNTITIVMPT